MSQTTDEIANLVQHAKDLGAKLWGELSDDAKSLFHKVTGQLDELHTKVADDLGDDKQEITGDASRLSTNAQGGVQSLSPSSPPVPAQHVPAGVPAADTTGTALAAQQAAAQQQAGTPSGGSSNTAAPDSASDQPAPSSDPQGTDTTTGDDQADAAPDNTAATTGEQASASSTSQS